MLKYLIGIGMAGGAAGAVAAISFTLKPSSENQDRVSPESLPREAVSSAVDEGQPQGQGSDNNFPPPLTII